MASKLRRKNQQKLRYSFGRVRTRSKIEAQETEKGQILVREVTNETKVDIDVFLSREGFFWFPSARLFVSRGAKIAIFEKARSSAARALRFLAVSRCFV